jgi:dTMP kinase
MPGRFITFEGLDGSGKSTHLKRIAGALEAAGTPHRVTHEPGGTPFGDAVRRVFLDPEDGPADGRVELLLVFASRRQHLLEVIEPALAAGQVVLCDRFTDSTLAYQGHGRGVPLDMIDQLDALATGRRRPDRTLLFDLPPEAARARGHSHDRHRRGAVNRLDREELEFYRRVREGYRMLAEAEPGRFRVIDSAGHPSRTEALVRRALADLLPVGQGCGETAGVGEGAASA